MVWQLQLYKENGIDANAFQGVPVFQAEGLTVNTEGGRQTPLFLSKDDLDKAIHAAFSQREAYRQEQTDAKHKRAIEELDVAKAKVPTSVIACAIELFPISSFEALVQSQHIGKRTKAFP